MLYQEKINDFDTQKVSLPQAQELLKQVIGWSLRQGRLWRRWDCSNFTQAKHLVDKISAVAEQCNHHPDIKFSFKYLELEIYTHKISGLTRADFILAAKINQDLDN